VRFEGQIAVYRSDLPDSPGYDCMFDGAAAAEGIAEYTYTQYIGIKDPYAS